MLVAKLQDELLAGEGRCEDTIRGRQNEEYVASSKISRWVDRADAVIRATGSNRRARTHTFHQGVREVSRGVDREVGGAGRRDDRI